MYFSKVSKWLYNHKHKFYTYGMDPTALKSLHQKKN